MKLKWFSLCLTAALVACQTNVLDRDSSTLEPQSVASAAVDTWRKQVIYLALPDRFYDGSTSNNTLGQPNCFDKNSPTKFHGGDLVGMQQRLGYIKNLGATALWMTPVYKQVGLVNGNSCGYHGYWPDYTNPSSSAIEPKFGTASEFSNLITTLHNSTYNMKFIMDMVVNHAGYGASVTSSNPSWFHGDCSGDEINCPLAGLPDFKQEDPAVATYLTNLSKAWASSYPIDGVRMDTAKHVPLSYWQNSWIPGMNTARSGMFLLAEAFLDSNANQIKPYYDAGFDSAFNFSLRSAMINTFAKGGSTDTLANAVSDYVGTLGLNRALLTVNLLDNHDVQRFVNEPGFGVSEDNIRRRYKMALAALMTLPGIPQIYYGNELGVYGANDPDNRKDMPAWAWTDAGRNVPQSGYLGGSSNDNTPKATFDYVKKLIGVRKTNAALWKGYYTEMWRQNSGASVYAFYRGSGTNRFVVVFNNGTLPSGNIGLNIAGNGGINSADRTALQNVTFDDQAGYCAANTVSSSNGTLTVNLPGQCVAIYKSR